MSNAHSTLTNPLLARLAAGQPVLGLSVRAVRSADIAHIAKASGHHFLFIDTQHAPFNIETLGHIAHAASAIGVVPTVRCRGVDDPDIPALLDNGMLGVIYPDISRRDQAECAVARAKFAPVGHRSSGGASPYFHFASRPAGEAMAEINGATLVACMIETLEGLENVEAIAAVEGVDILHMGTNDLLVAMGRAGDFDCPEIIAAQRRVTAAARANGKYAGCGGNRDVIRQARAINDGALFLTTQTDIGLMLAGASAWTAALAAELGR